ncbi:hypothetical protein CONLIGDRAFT_642929 [Coniochaeta ligniaria NRRL 30616]|uniref:Uncharacterized protein n=1 Tax=Coniochaeta ligniaria NRRL 30616 TaxID=1408157 RepID=A0A1J7IU92_9PEZI|nr:hypothetical protein CONLIGDRAFT_642929 [Coniochaeta ligniaria NRRL 30616]
MPDERYPSLMGSPARTPRPGRPRPASRHQQPVRRAPAPRSALAHSKEADSSGGPSPERDFPDTWPTLVIEAGFSQSLSELQKAVRWWFAEPLHDVKIVLIVKFEPTT